MITDRARFEPLGLGIHMAVALRAAYRDQWKPDGMLKFLGDQPTYGAILEGRDVDSITDLWKGELSGFRSTREKYLLYK